jgi:exodeoxyribonuclease VIII
MELYNRWDVARSSTLSKLAKGATPYELKQESDNQTPSKGMGSALHLAVWEPELYQSHTEIWTDTKTRAKGFMARQEEMADGHYLLTSGEASAVSSMMVSMQGPKIQQYLRAVTERELSVVFDLVIRTVDPDTMETVETTLRTKARLDGLAPAIRSIVDLKSTQSAKPSDFTWSIKKYGYHHQAALYLEAARVVADELDIDPPLNHVILAVQNEPTWRAVPYRLTEQAIETAWLELTPAIVTMAECYATGSWPDVPNDITTDIGLPEE